MPNGGTGKGPLTWGIKLLAPSTQGQYQTTKLSLPAQSYNFIIQSTKERCRRSQTVQEKPLHFKKVMKRILPAINIIFIFEQNVSKT